MISFIFNQSLQHGRIPWELRIYAPFNIYEWTQWEYHLRFLKIKKISLVSSFGNDNQSGNRMIALNDLEMRHACHIRDI